MLDLKSSISNAFFVGAGTRFLELAVLFFIRLTLRRTIFRTTVFHFIVLLIVRFVLLVVHKILLLNLKILINQRRGALLSHALERQMKFDVALFRFAKRTYFPGFRSNVRVTAFATNPKDRAIVFIKRAVLDSAC